MIVAGLALAVAILGACSRSVDCSGGVYANGCVQGTATPAPETPAPMSPASVTPAPVSSAPVSPAVAPAAVVPAAVGRGDPNAFADVDDKQCRSYGLAFGSHDYADCRIRLSAQHRGLDPGR
jgi:hypothetical protein